MNRLQANRPQVTPCGRFFVKRSDGTVLSGYSADLENRVYRTHGWDAPRSLISHADGSLKTEPFGSRLSRQFPTCGQERLPERLVEIENTLEVLGLVGLLPAEDLLLNE